MIASVIIPAYNAEEILPGLLDALSHQEGLKLGQDYEILVVDDGSSDRTADVAIRLGARTVSQPNAGPAAARNHGARLAQAPLLAYTDADCIPAADWLSNLIAPFSDPEVVGVKGVYRTQERGVVARFVQAEYAFKYQRMRALPQIDFIDTYSAAYRRDIFIANGGFDERFPVPSVEDQEFSFRLARQGLKMVFQPTAAVYHRHDHTLLEYARRKFGIGYWKAFMLRKMPEKALGDSHTSPTQPWEILLTGLIAATLGLYLFYPAGGWLALGSLAAFFILILPFLSFLKKLDRELLWAAPGLLLVRAATLGVGLAAGFIFAPKSG